MNKVTVREPGQKVLEELNIANEKAVQGLYVADGPQPVPSRSQRL